MVMKGGKIDKKQEIIEQFEKNNFDDCEETVKSLKDIQTEHSDLYNVGCSIEKAHKYATLTHSGGIEKNICEYFNEWVNEKKKSYTSNGDNCDKVQLWENYIENLWFTLGNSSDTKNWCTRTGVTYACKNSAPYVTGIVICFILMATVATVFFFIYNFSTHKNRFLGFINKNERIRNYLYKYGLQFLLEDSENTDTHSLSGRFNLAYHSAQNY
ncbi:PIR Superfamily Protein [Plasmodium ovale wallikeri]|uniref:PIR Superfamily Protein n=1 Tax=Plasmodium ovale wallikeri TaxID=864142 RepID=A0A1A9ASM1_PLAOA|nr:PIR Superfamily Protein [Plasmodium ovale wallikeri]SBT59119.1 PIR Superfamily Protein [Plasmodium ovale wallikeri]